MEASPNTPRKDEVECGCCQDARGFKSTLPEEAKEFMRNRYPYGPDEYYSRSTHLRFKRIVKASIFGLVKDRIANPFDHIDRRPKYQ